MELLLIRHAIAEEAAAGAEDAARPLTARGTARFRRAVAGLDALGLTIDRVLHSPWTRAVQTAELLAPILTGTARATELLTAEPGDDLLGLLADQPRDQRLAVVGHEPWISDLLALLCFGSTRHGEQIRFKKGATALLDGEPIRAGMELVALLPPRPLRKLGK